MANDNSSTLCLYNTIEAALHALAENQSSPPTLEELAKMCGMSDFHFQKQFRRWVGMSPKRFSQYLSREHIKGVLDEGLKPLDACYQAGLSGPGRMHGLFIDTLGMTPSQCSEVGKNFKIHFGFHPSPFGTYLLGVASKGICHICFVDGDPIRHVAMMESEWPSACFGEDVKKTRQVHEQLFGQRRTQQSVTLLLKGTQFQIQVWEALLRIPIGSISTYENIAALTGKPSATRACASAIARNNIGWLIPCHRVVRKIGESGKYRWGSSRKKLMLAYETVVSRGASQ